MRRWDREYVAGIWTDFEHLANSKQSEISFIFISDAVLSGILTYLIYFEHVYACVMQPGAVVDVMENFQS